MNDEFPAFSSKANGMLQRLIYEDTTVILTTPHKSNYALDEWKEIFSKRGINIEKIMSLNNNLTNLSRKDKILNWFRINNTIEDFIIIDDDKSLHSLPGFFKVKIDFDQPFYRYYR